MNTKADIDFSISEINLVIEALQARASRHESMSRARPQTAGPHDRAAIAMRKLAQRLTKERDPSWDGRE